ncbi:NAD(P)H-dependent oxidoreductase [Kribbella sp. NPDC050820]|uniref:NADPH-dependent FMN reductase n=1 Tax=Kribbella sp. NPDC050820 TaxID=3155408 RepID=UPI0033EF586F
MSAIARAGIVAPAGTRTPGRERPQHEFANGSAVVPCTVLVGSPRRQSRTQAVTEQLAQRTCRELSATGLDIEPARLVDVRELSPIALDGQQDEVQAAIAELTRPGLLFIGSPTYLESFSGMLKLLLDLVPRDGLGRTVAVPVMTAADPRHRMAVDRSLAPLLVAMGATVPAPGLSVLVDDMPQLDGLLDTWVEAACSKLAAALRQTC